MKRFTDTEKWFDEWFRKLPTDYKLFWNYLCDRCNNAGVWKEDVELANMVMFARDARGVNMQTAQAIYEDRIHQLRPGYWLIRGFVSFQFGDLSPTNRMHASVLALLEKEGAFKALKRPIARGQGKVKERKGAVREGMGGSQFEDIWSRYPRRLGRKDAERHFNASVKTPQDWADINNALNNFIAQIRKEHTGAEFILHGKTWFNNWRDYISYAGVQLPQSSAAPVKPPPCSHKNVRETPGQTTNCPDCNEELYMPTPGEFTSIVKPKGIPHAST